MAAFTKTLLTVFGERIMYSNVKDKLANYKAFILVTVS